MKKLIGHTTLLTVLFCVFFARLSVATPCNHCDDGNGCTIDTLELTVNGTANALVTFIDFMESDTLMNLYKLQKNYDLLFGETMLDCAPLYQAQPGAVITEDMFMDMWMPWHSSTATVVRTELAFVSKSRIGTRTDMDLHLFNPLDYLGYGKESKFHNTDFTSHVTYYRRHGTDPIPREVWVQSKQCTAVYVNGTKAGAWCNSNKWKTVRVNLFVNASTMTEDSIYTIDVFYVNADLPNSVLIVDRGTPVRAECSNIQSTHCVQCVDVEFDCPPPSECNTMTCQEGLCLEVPNDELSCTFPFVPTCTEPTCLDGRCVPQPIDPCCDVGSQCAPYDSAYPCMTNVYNEACECVQIPFDIMMDKVCRDGEAPTSMCNSTGHCVPKCPVIGGMCTPDTYENEGPCTHPVCNDEQVCLYLPVDDMTTCITSETSAEGYCIEGICVENTCDNVGESPCISRGTAVVPDATDCTYTICSPDHTCDVVNEPNGKPCTEDGVTEPSVCSDGVCKHGCTTLCVESDCFTTCPLPEPCPELNCSSCNFTCPDCPVPDPCPELNCSTCEFTCPTPDPCPELNCSTCSFTCPDCPTPDPCPSLNCSTCNFTCPAVPDVCYECYNASQCDDTHFWTVDSCSAGYCAHVGDAPECLTDGDCATGYHCSEFDYTCIPYPPGYDGDCVVVTYLGGDQWSWSLYPGCQPCGSDLYNIGTQYAPNCTLCPSGSCSGGGGGTISARTQYCDVDEDCGYCVDGCVTTCYPGACDKRWKVCTRYDPTTVFTPCTVDSNCTSDKICSRNALTLNTCQKRPNTTGYGAKYCSSHFDCVKFSYFPYVSICEWPSNMDTPDEVGVCKLYYRPIFHSDSLTIPTNGTLMEAIEVDPLCIPSTPAEPFFSAKCNSTDNSQCLYRPLGSAGCVTEHCVVPESLWVTYASLSGKGFCLDYGTCPLDTDYCSEDNTCQPECTGMLCQSGENYAAYTCQECCSTADCTPPMECGGGVCVNV